MTLTFPDFSTQVKNGYVTDAVLQQFRGFVFSYYQESGRHDMEWRHTDDPYHITVSEIMLQQTQVSRVETMYPKFISLFPTAAALARASEAEVLSAWQGMGYNRRALSLQKLCRIITDEYNGVFPKTPEELIKLPGLGPATSCSIAAFAYNYPAVFIETNIRRVFIHCFFRERREVDDSELFPLVKAALPENAREWYWALMDIGSAMKQGVENPNRKSRQYVKQSAFEGSNRQLRGNVLKKMLEVKEADAASVAGALGCEKDAVKNTLDTMVKEGFFVCDTAGVYRMKGCEPEEEKQE